MSTGLSLSHIRDELLSTGKLRAAINHGNPVLAQRGPGGEPRGVSVALAQALASRLNVALEVVPFEAAGKVVDAAGQNVWDVGFLAIDPMRADQVSFTSPYVLIEGTYLLRDDSRFTAIDQLDTAGARIAVGQGAAYDLFLSRALQHAQLVRAPTSAAAVDLFLEQGLDAAAGVRQPLETAARRHAGLKVLPGYFTAIRQAVATPAKNVASLPFLQAFIEEMKASGLVARALQDSGQGEATVAPAE
ncbi:ABC transporter substrate-binding protein [Pusillimonas sp. MFBS29]|uniref:ABC transporter substrate-binding protein n=1 Tax=Pusillimonas sp. MFBS29 TaxID=2886690 RepID=UPI001D122A93|nr:ABC transporter substrate-binding protein [Pusillimonas sp. MFBS29]MCC2596969.1 ABC transporter substrate-binding protein [Pusillimonas sp. MFBS29]